ncbi:MAG: GNAT family N-acetyltransferase [Betaproteobacteria bacterium]|nr:GNAT family N-acetyltransferase [Betaproteobacteria bacterium]
MRPDIEPAELETPRLVLRPYCDAYAKELHAAARESVATVGAWMPWCHAGYTEDDSTAWVRKARLAWRNGEEFAFAMFDRTGRYAGGAGLNNFNALHNLANLGYWIRESRQREGLAVESTIALAKFGFQVLGLTRIEIVAAEGNRPSRRVAQKAGATFECLARNRLVIHGVPVVAAVHSLVPGDIP